MSAIGTKRTSPSALHMSAFGGKADILFATGLGALGLLEPPKKKKRASRCCRLGACGKLSAHKGFQVWHRSNQLPAIANLPRN
jgi:hypothetical protein